MVDSLNTKKVQSLARQRQMLAKKAKHSHFADVVNQWFCEQMVRQRGGVSRHIWAVAYHTVGRWILGAKPFFILMLLGVLYLGYLSSTGLPFVIAMLCFVMSQMAASVAGGCALLMTEGRKQRFEMAMAGSLATQGLATAICLGMILLSYGLALFMPTIPLGGDSFQFHALPWWVLMLPWGIMPALIGVGLLFPKQSVWLLGASAGAMFPCLIILTKNNYLADLNAPSLVLYALLVCLSWCVLLACTHWHCFKRDLG